MVIDSGVVPKLIPLLSHKEVKVRILDATDRWCVVMMFVLYLFTYFAYFPNHMQNMQVLRIYKCGRIIQFWPGWF
jgi:hypothetical protein